jgi:hypothetical protein
VEASRMTVCPLSTLELYDRVSICAGWSEIRSANYVEGACVPRGDWRKVSEAEIRQMVGDSGPGSTIYLLRLPTDFSSPLGLIRSALAENNDLTVAENLFQHRSYRKAVRGMVESLLALGCGGQTIRILGHYAREPGLPTASRAYPNGDGPYVGLHIDSWSSVSWAEKLSAPPTRLCVNLGPEPRYFVFHPVVIDNLCSDDQTVTPEEAVREFLRRRKSESLYRLQIGPGEAYVAPTERFIHDATTVDKRYVDASVTLLGTFPRAALARFVTLS